MILTYLVGEDVEGVRNYFIRILEEMEGTRLKLYIRNGKNFDFCARQMEYCKRFSMSVYSAHNAWDISEESFIACLKETTEWKYLKASFSIQIKRVTNILNWKKCWENSYTFDCATNKVDGYMYVGPLVTFRADIEKFKNGNRNERFLYCRVFLGLWMVWKYLIWSIVKFEATICCYEWR